MPPTVEGIGLLFLLPFCSHNTPTQGGTRRRTTHHQTTWNRLLPNAFRARSEGYRTWPCCTHNPKVAGSNPAPATTKYLKSKGVDRCRPLWCLRPTMKFCDRSALGGGSPTERPARNPAPNALFCDPHGSLGPTSPS